MNQDSYITYTDTATKSGIDINAIASIVVAYCLICGIVTALVAKNNGRSIPLGFVAGIFLGHFGIIAHMIMGQSDTPRKR